MKATNYAWPLTSIELVRSHGSIQSTFCSARLTSLHYLERVPGFLATERQKLCHRDKCVSMGRGSSCPQQPEITSDKQKREDFTCADLQCKLHRLKIFRCNDVFKLMAGTLQNLLDCL